MKKYIANIEAEGVVVFKGTIENLRDVDFGDVDGYETMGHFRREGESTRGLIKVYFSVRIQGETEEEALAEAHKKSMDFNTGDVSDLRIVDSWLVTDLEG